MVRFIECPEDVHNCHRVYVFRRRARRRAELELKPYLSHCPLGKGEDCITVKVLSSDEDASARTMAQRNLKLVSFSTFASLRYNHGHYE